MATIRGLSPGVGKGRRSDCGDVAGAERAGQPEPLPAGPRQPGQPPAPHRHCAAGVRPILQVSAEAQPPFALLGSIPDPLAQFTSSPFYI